MYGGLRLGELRALRVCDVDLAGGVIRVERGWDPSAGLIELKSQAGRRRVPIAAVLRDYLAEHLARPGRRDSELIFGNTPEVPFTPNMLQRRADQAWSAAGLERITPHACRHTFASLMIAAGVNAKALSVFMGHANISITLDRYGHLMPGSEEEAAGLLNSYLTAKPERAEQAAREAGGMLAGEPTGEQVAVGSV
jgi:integrase